MTCRTAWAGEQLSVNQVCAELLIQPLACEISEVCTRSRHAPVVRGPMENAKPLFVGMRGLDGLPLEIELAAARCSQWFAWRRGWDSFPWFLLPSTI
jgi:hypothetical protein